MLEVGMKALVWHGTADIRCESVPDPRIEQDRDAIIKVTSCAICGSDLHLFDHFMPGMQSAPPKGAARDFQVPSDMAVRKLLRFHVSVSGGIARSLRPTTSPLTCN